MGCLGLVCALLATLRTRQAAQPHWTCCAAQRSATRCCSQLTLAAYTHTACHSWRAILAVQVTALRFSRNGALLASGSKDTDIVVWDVAGEAGLYRLRGHRDQVRCAGRGCTWVQEQLHSWVGQAGGWRGACCREAASHHDLTSNSTLRSLPRNAHHSI